MNPQQRNGLRVGLVCLVLSALVFLHIGSEMRYKPGESPYDYYYLPIVLSAQPDEVVVPKGVGHILLGCKQYPGTDLHVSKAHSSVDMTIMQLRAGDTVRISVLKGEFDRARSNSAARRNFDQRLLSDNTVDVYGLLYRGKNYINYGRLVDKKSRPMTYFALFMIGAVLFFIGLFKMIRYKTV